MKPGHCVVCDTPTWRMAFDPGSNQEILLWPKPDSVYAGIRHEGLDSHGERSQSLIAAGISYCPSCAPAVGERSAAVPGAIEVVELERARERYARWYTASYGDWLRAHARDQLRMDDVAITKLLKQWEDDRA